MNAITRALKKGDATAQAPAQQQPPQPPSPRRGKRGHAAIDPSDPTHVAKQHLTARADGDMDLGMLDQEAFARVMASGQQPQALVAAPLPEMLEPPARDGEDDEDASHEIEDATYFPSTMRIDETADPIGSLRLACLPVLDIFSTQLLNILSSHPHSTILQIVTGNPPSAFSQNYSTLLQLFDVTKKQLYSQDQAFLDPDIIGFKDLQERKVVRKANLATFISSVFGSVDVGFFHLNEGFLGTFAPDGGRLLKDIAKLLLDLKTQAYISAMGQPSRDQNSILNDLFPSVQQLTYLFVARRSAQPITSPPTHDDLTPAEVEFISKCERRREHLRSLGDSEAKVQELKEIYSWEAFLRELRGYVAKNWEVIVGSRGGKPRRPTKKRTSTEGPGAAGGFMDMNSVQNLMQQQEPAPQPPMQSTTPQQPPQQPASMPTTLHDPPTLPIQEAYERAKSATITATTMGPAGATLGTPITGIPPPSPGTGTQTTPRPSGEGNQIRRPWSKEEEAALFAGLEAVRGPNWAAILQLYGPGGSISEALKDRSQVQLKDKARNLKLFFLKGGHPIPPILNLVTGRLKGEPPEETPGRHKKRPRLALDRTEAQTQDVSSQPVFAPENWTPTRADEFTAVGANVDPGLAMPQGN